MEGVLRKRVGGLSRPMIRRNRGDHDVPVIARSQMSAAKASEPDGVFQTLGWRHMKATLLALIGFFRVTSDDRLVQSSTWCCLFSLNSFTGSVECTGC